MTHNQSDGLAIPRNHGIWHFAFEEAREDQEKEERETILLCVLRGQVRATINGFVLEAKAGDLMIVPPSLPYHRLISAGTEFVVACFALCLFEFDDSPRVLSVPEDELAVRWIKDLALLAAGHSGQRDVTDHLLTAVLSRLKQIERRESALRAFHPAVAAAVQFLDDNIALPLTLQEVAARVHLSPSHLRTLFHRQVGSGVLRYQQDRRMQLALKLLDQPNLSMSDVARRCGYKDTEYFARLFRRYHHVSPGKFRHLKQSP